MKKNTCRNTVNLVRAMRIQESVQQRDYMVCENVRSFAITNHVAEFLSAIVESKLKVPVFHEVAPCFSIIRMQMINSISLQQKRK